jgi:8-amino-7-oxononanoate synthase
VLVDAGCYPLLLWAAAQRGTPVRVAHYRPAVLAAALATLRPGERPIFVVDGFCVGCGRAAPLAAYARLLAQWGGRLLVDDTQAMGLHGPGGGGTPAHGAPYNTVLRLASLSKAFNVPLAFLSGTRADMVTFRGFSASRVYCSPPATPTVIAATRALLLNRLAGGRLRVALRAAVLMFRRACAACSVPLIPGLFPVQTVVAETGAAEIVEALAERGLLAFASRGFHDRTAKLRLIVTAAHRPSELLHAAKTLAAVLYKPEVDLYEPEGVSLGGLKPTGHYAFFDHRSTSNG